MTIDIARARADTPGCEKVLHFNNAGAGLMPKPVLDASIGHLVLESEMGGYEAADQARDAIERVYSSTARLIGCRPHEIAFMASATRAWDMAFYSLPLGPGDKILTCMAEYGSNFIPYLQLARKRQVQVQVIPDDESGGISIPRLADALDESVKLIAVTHVPTNGGLVNPAAEVGRIARDAGILYLLDACQSVGQMPIDVRDIGCHMLSATGRKFLRGPRGTGFLYVDEDLIGQLEPPFLDIHAADWIAADRYEIRTDARRFETWEANYAAKIGLGAAMDYALEWGMENIWTRVKLLADQLRARLNAIPGVTLYDRGETLCGIVSFNVQGRPPDSVQEELLRSRVNVSVSPARYTRLDMDARGLGALVRASLHYYNTRHEVDRFCDLVSRLSAD